ncbi:MAG: hypothetical protein J6M17_09930 [Ruminococcus sp.]|nr:hypothetical protein [Ruminococcus sp.]
MNSSNAEIGRRQSAALLGSMASILALISLIGQLVLFPGQMDRTSYALIVIAAGGLIFSKSADRQKNKIKGE